MQDLEKNILDRLIDDFSSEDLKKRVWGMTLLGLAICAAIAIGSYFFLNYNFTVEAGGPETPFWKLLWMGK